MTDDDRHAVNAAFANVGKALAAYERRIVSRRAPFDVFVEGLLEGDAEKLAALDESAQRGLRLFVGRANCIECHAGPTFSNGSFHSNGIPPTDGGELTDAGRFDGIERIKRGDFNAAGSYSDASPEARAAALDKIQALERNKDSWGAFKTPTLRNVALSAPYMHEGQVATLDDVLRHYNTLEDSVFPGQHAETRLTPLRLTDDSRPRSVLACVDGPGDRSEADNAAARLRSNGGHHSAASQPQPNGPASLRETGPAPRGRASISLESPGARAANRGCSTLRCLELPLGGGESACCAGVRTASDWRVRRAGSQLHASVAAGR